MGFTADLNPKKSAMDLGDLMKMEDAMIKRKAYDNAMKAKPLVKTATPGADSVMNNLKSSPTDVGVPFKFGNNYQSEE
jgi:hypothetical protein